MISLMSFGLFFCFYSIQIDALEQKLKQSKTDLKNVHSHVKDMKHNDDYNVVINLGNVNLKQEANMQHESYQIPESLTSGQCQASCTYVYDRGPDGNEIECCILLDSRGDANCGYPIEVCENFNTCCGDIGNVLNCCRSDQKCYINGQCCYFNQSYCGYSCCDNPKTCCNDQCVDLMIDNNNCGQCGNHCSHTNEYCFYGNCCSSDRICGLNICCLPGQSCVPDFGCSPIFEKVQHVTVINEQV